jgi:hypothetical protein
VYLLGVLSSWGSSVALSLCAIFLFLFIIIIVIISIRREGTGFLKAVDFNHTKHI